MKRAPTTTQFTDSELGGVKLKLNSPLKILLGSSNCALCSSCIHSCFSRSRQIKLKSLWGTSTFSNVDIVIVGQRRWGHFFRTAFYRKKQDIMLGRDCGIKLKVCVKMPLIMLVNYMNMLVNTLQSTFLWNRRAPTLKPQTAEVNDSDHSH